MNMGELNSNRRYAMDIRERFGLEGRTYIWRGGVYPAGHEQAGQEWCFAYGEREWMTPEFEVLVFDAEGNPQLQPAGFQNYQERADGNEVYREGCL